jgi:hypothetical protein
MEINALFSHLNSSRVLSSQNGSLDPGQAGCGGRGVEGRWTCCLYHMYIMDGGLPRVCGSAIWFFSFSGSFPRFFSRWRWGTCAKWNSYSAVQYEVCNDACKRSGAWGGAAAGEAGGGGGGGAGRRTVLTCQRHEHAVAHKHGTCRCTLYTCQLCI